MRLHCAKWPCNAGKRVDAAFGALDSSTRDRFKRQKTPLGMNSRALSGVLQTFLSRSYPAMLMEGTLPNYFTINGKAFPATDTVKMRVGETIKLRFVGSNNNFVHPMHVHGGPFTVIARDGNVVPEAARFDADTINVGPGQRYDVIWKARRPGKWLVHCHIPHHTTNNNVEEQGGGGLMMILDVEA